MAEIVTPTGAIIRTGFIKGTTSAGGVTVTPEASGKQVRYIVSSGGRKKKITPKAGETVVVEESGETRPQTIAEAGESRLTEVAPRVAVERKVNPRMTYEEGGFSFALGGISRPGSMEYYDSEGNRLVGPRRDIAEYNPPGPGELPLEKRYATKTEEGQTTKQDITLARWSGVNSEGTKKGFKSGFYEFFASPVRGTGQVIRKGYEKSPLNILTPEKSKVERVEQAMILSSKVVADKKIGKITYKATAIGRELEKQTRWNPQDVKTAATWAAWGVGLQAAPTITGLIGTPLIGKQVYTTVRNPTGENLGGTAALLLTVGLGSVVKSGKVRISVKVKDRLAMPKTKSQTAPTKAKQLKLLAEKTKRQGALDKRAAYLSRKAIEKRRPFDYLTDSSKKPKQISSKINKVIRKDIVRDLRQSGYRWEPDSIKNLAKAKAKYEAGASETIYYINKKALKNKKGSIGGTRQQLISITKRKLSYDYTKQTALKSSPLKPILLSGLSSLSNNAFVIAPPVPKSRSRISSFSYSSTAPKLDLNIKGIATQSPFQSFKTGGIVGTKLSEEVVLIPKIKQSSALTTVAGVATATAASAGVGIAVYEYFQNRRYVKTADKFGGGILSGYKGPSKSRRVTQYTPSLVGLEYKIKGRPGILTGLGVRGI